MENRLNSIKENTFYCFGFTIKSFFFLSVCLMRGFFKLAIFQGLIPSNHEIDDFQQGLSASKKPLRLQLPFVGKLQKINTLIWISRIKQSKKKTAVDRLAELLIQFSYYSWIYLSHFATFPFEISHIIAFVHISPSPFLYILRLSFKCIKST